MAAQRRRPAIVRFPGAATIRWVESALGRGWRVVGGRRLLGGISSSVHRLAVEAPGGQRVQVVLRRWVVQWSDDPAATVEHEARVLRHVHEHAHRSRSADRIPAPEVLATSSGADTDGHAALLMTRVPGHLHLSPVDPERWLQQMARTLVAIHDLPAVLRDDDVEPREPGPTPAWTQRPDLLQRALAITSEPAPATHRCFVHGDYQHFNLLWSRERLTVVVDWTYSASGHPDRDVAHCRRNLTILFSPDWADRFLDFYKAETGRGVHPWFDLRCLTGFDEEWQRFIPVQVAGRIPVDVAGMPARVDEAIARVLRSGEL